MPTDTETPFHELTSDADWDAAREASHDRPVVIFKHSNACPTSGRANREMSQLAESGDAPVYRVTVQTHRPVSNRIADDLDTRHETPQVFVLSGGTPVFDTSHFKVKADVVREAMEKKDA